MLSDACFEFLHALREAAMELRDQVGAYGEAPFGYGKEIEGLRKACEDAEANAYDPEPLVRLVRLAASVQVYHDAPPGATGEEDRRAAMLKLIDLVRADLDQPDRTELRRLLPDLMQESQKTEKSSWRVREILGKLGKSTYDMGVKVLTDVLSETAKKILGL